MKITNINPISWSERRMSERGWKERRLISWFVMEEAAGIQVTGIKVIDDILHDWGLQLYDWESSNPVINGG